MFVVTSRRATYRGRRVVKHFRKTHRSSSQKISLSIGSWFDVRRDDVSRSPFSVVRAMKQLTYGYVKYSRAGSSTFYKGGPPIAEFVVVVVGV